MYFNRLLYKLLIVLYPPGVIIDRLQRPGDRRSATAIITKFKRGEAATFRLNASDNSFSASVKAWIEATNAIGLHSKAGRYGGTYAHREIALTFCYWLSPTFQVYLIKEFDRLKAAEAKELGSEWNIKRIMSKANYRIHTEAVRMHLIPPKLQYTSKEGIFFANEADLINMALFGITAKQWRQANPKLKGNIRDHATTEQLLVLSNLQALNASLLEWDCDQVQRLELLNKAAIDQMSILIGSMQISEQSVPPISAKVCHSYRSKPCHSYRSKVCHLS